VIGVNTVEIAPVINGREIALSVPVRMTLAEMLRDRLHLFGVKLSCEMQVCGVCTVLVDNRPVSSCTFLAADVDRKQVLTIEGLADGEELHPIQQAFVDHFALQCGFCTPGFIMMAKQLLDRSPSADRDEIVEHFDGNLCRCTGYVPIVEAVLAASKKMRGRSA
jgi:aerobic-type carbon monoxide dehydrogenase small subunit (CoxS/CutS family)